MVGYDGSLGGGGSAVVATDVVSAGFGVVGVTNLRECFGGGDVLVLGPFLKGEDYLSSETSYATPTLGAIKMTSSLRGGGGVNEMQT